MPPGTKYVGRGRGTKWGNPFKIGSYLNAWGKAFVSIELGGTTPDGVRKIYDSGIFDEPISLENSLKWYRLWLKFQVKNCNLDLNEFDNYDNIACWCPIDKACHGDIIIEAYENYKINGNLKGWE